MASRFEKSTNPGKVAEKILDEIRYALNEDTEQSLRPLIVNSFDELAAEAKRHDLHPLAGLCLLNKYLGRIMDLEIAKMITDQNSDPKVLIEVDDRYCALLDEIAHGK